MEIFNTIIGASAEGNFYFRRPYLDARLWKHIQNGSHILVSAPRRIGKTSFLLNICNLCKDSYHAKYHITQSVNRPNEFFKRLYKSLLEECTIHQNMWESIGEILKKNKIERVGTSGVELNHADLDYFEEFRRLINKIPISKKLVFIIDEFSEALENIINDQGDNAGQLFLHQNRELRQDKNISNKIQFIYSGSIGLGNITERICAIKSINDLTDFPIPPLSREETFAMIDQVTVSPELIFDEKVKQYLMRRIHWLMPFYLQIILDEIEDILLKTGGLLKVDKKIVDRAIDEALKRRNYFEHWHTRLRTAFKGKDYTFAKEVLNAASKAQTGINKNQIFDLAKKYELEDDHNIILRTLEYDGYLTPDAQKIFVFNSPLLKTWWERNIAI